MNSELQHTIAELKVCLLIPTYNHASFLSKVLEQSATVPIPIMVVNDGSTDNTRQIVEEFENKKVDFPFHYIEQYPNQGKGAALKKGAALARKLGYQAIITMDSDGQHDPKDIALFVETAILDPQAIIVGSRGFDHENMPQKNSFANRFSNFWFKLQTAIPLPDTQSGFRYYPLFVFEKKRWFTDRYNFELEILVRNVWRGVKVIDIPIHVYYPPKDIRVTHFRPFVDFARISLLNTLLTLLALIYFYPKKGLQFVINLFKRNPKKES